MVMVSTVFIRFKILSKDKVSNVPFRLITHISFVGKTVDLFMRLICVLFFFIFLDFLWSGFVLFLCFLFIQLLISFTKLCLYYFFFVCFFCLFFLFFVFVCFVCFFCFFCLFFFLFCSSNTIMRIRNLF